MDTKVCSKCKIEKEFCDFRKRKDSKDGLRAECKDCSSFLGKKYREINKDWVKCRKKKYYLKHRDQILEKVKKYRIENIDHILKKDKQRSKQRYQENPEKLKKYYENNKEKILNYKKVWSKKNKEKINEQKKEYIKKRKAKDILFYLKFICRSRISSYLKSHNITKKNKTFEMVGCTPQQLKEHLEKQFKPGMSWDNRNQWHIDHIIPLSSAKTEEELYKLCHFSNLQPLWAEENIIKSNKIVIL